MASRLLCIPCSTGACDDCIPHEPAPEGVLGGNSCPCLHDEQARSRSHPLIDAILRRLKQRNASSD